MVDVVAELLHHLEGEREPGRRAADVAGVDLHADRQMDVGRLLRREADDRLTSCRCGSAIVLTLVRRLRRAALDADRRTAPGCALRKRVRSAVIVGVGLPLIATITSSGWSLPTASLLDVERGDDDAARRRRDLVAEPPQRDRGGDALRDRSSARRSALTLLRVVEPGGTIRFAGTSVAPAWMHGKSDSSMLARRSNTSTK